MRVVVIAFVAIFTLFSSSCTPTLPTIEQSELSDSTKLIRTSNDGWYPNEKIIWNKGLLDRYPDYTHREGITSGGNKYTYFNDGAGHVAPISPKNVIDKWNFSCPIDDITDKVKCELKSRDANIVIFFNPNLTPITICIIGHDFPGRTGAIRVDKNKAIRTNTDGCIAASRIYKQMLAGKETTVRMVTWPDDYNRDTSNSLSGFPESVQLWKFVRDNLARLSF